MFEIVKQAFFISCHVCAQKTLKYIMLVEIVLHTNEKQCSLINKYTKQLVMLCAYNNNNGYYFFW